MGYRCCPSLFYFFFYFRFEKRGTLVFFSKLRAMNKRVTALTSENEEGWRGSVDSGNFFFLCDDGKSYFYMYVHLF